MSKYKKLNEALVGLVEDYSLVSFTAMDIKVGLEQIPTLPRLLIYSTEQ